MVNSIKSLTRIKKTCIHWSVPEVWELYTLLGKSIINQGIRVITEARGSTILGRKLYILASLSRQIIIITPSPNFAVVS